MAEFVYEDLSFKINGIAFEIYKTLGGDLKEKVYAEAFAELLERDGIPFRREVYYPVRINNKTIGKNYFDFIVYEKIVLELKRGSANYIQACKQLADYLKLSGLKLGLIIRFTKDGAKVKRIVNIT